MDKPYVSLGFYKPREWNARKVGMDLVAITKAAGLVPHVDPKHGPLHSVPWFSDTLHAEVRRRTFKTNQAESFHYDGDTTPGSKPDCCLVLWASNTPTEIQWQGKIYIPKPYEIVVFKNKECLHRRPDSVPRIRWVFRQRVAVPNPLFP